MRSCGIRIISNIPEAKAESRKPRPPSLWLLRERSRERVAGTFSERPEGLIETLDATYSLSRQYYPHKRPPAGREAERRFGYSYSRIRSEGSALPRYPLPPAPRVKRPKEETNPPHAPQQLTMDEAERETSRLFRVNRTIHELVRDRVSCSLPRPTWPLWARALSGALKLVRGSAGRSIIQSA